MHAILSICCNKFENVAVCMFPVYTPKKKIHIKYCPNINETNKIIIIHAIFYPINDFYITEIGMHCIDSSFELKAFEFGFNQ